MKIEIISFEKLKKRLMEKNLCLVIGPEYLIDKFCKDQDVRVDYIMISETELAKIYNTITKEDFLFGTTDRDSLISIIPIGMKIDEENLIGVKLTKEMYEDGCKKTASIIHNNSEIVLLSYIQDIIARQNK